jgi:hypothetical protein
VASDALAHLTNNLQPTLIYSTSMSRVDYIMKSFDNDNTRRRESGHAELVAKRLDGNTDLADIQDVIAKVEINDPQDPVHEIVATNVVSHGVDIERLNMELFTGWPKSTAEYLQSSSRSGRTHPGIVIAGLSYSNLYEYSIYARFREYHQFMDRLIEAVPINRFALNVLSRTLPGIFTGILFNWARHQPWGANIKPYDASTIYQAIKDNEEARNQLIDMMVGALNVARATELNVFSQNMLSEFEAELRRLAERIVEVFRNLPSRFSKDSAAQVLHYMTGIAPLLNFRDIDKQIKVKAADMDSKRVLAGISR